MIEIMDFNECPQNSRSGSYGGMAGSKEGIIYNGENWIVKYPKSTRSMRVNDVSYTTASLSEYIGSHIYEILGYDVHKTLLGIRNGKLVVACKDFCAHEGELREIRTIKNIYSDRLEIELDKSFTSTGEGHIVNLPELFIHFDYNPVLSNIDGLRQRFWDCVIIDGLIGNNDRNNGNWGLLLKDGKYKLAPVYDNGAAFSNKVSDERLAYRLSNPSALRAGATDVETAYGIADRKLKFTEILELDNDDLLASVMRVVPEIISRYPEMRDLIKSIPNSHQGFTVIADVRKEYYIRCLDIRIKEILIPTLERVKTL